LHSRLGGLESVGRQRFWSILTFKYIVSQKSSTPKVMAKLCQLFLT